MWTRFEDKSTADDGTSYFSPAGPSEIHVRRRARAKGDIVFAYLVRGDANSIVPHSAHRPATPDDVRLLRDLLTLTRWVRPSAPSTDMPAGDDYEVVMRLTSTPNRYTSLVRTTRRHGDWTFVDETGGEAARRLTITNEAARFKLIFISEQAGSLQSLMLGRLPDELTPPLGGAPEDLNRRAQILGETCEWFDIRPATMDASLWECRTHDGITLESFSGGWGSQQIFTAVRLSRRPIGRDEVMPPSELVEPKRWGLE
jgi:hypothetical protein